MGLKAAQFVDFGTCADRIIYLARFFKPANKLAKGTELIRVLCVDDEPYILDITKAFLEQSVDLRVEMTQSGYRANVKIVFILPPLLNLV